MKLLLISIIVFGLAGCGDTITDNSTTINGTYIQNEDGTVTYIGNDQNGGNTTEESAYNPNYNEEQCTAAGFFFCPISGKCLNQPSAGGSCTASVIMLEEA